MGEVGGIGRREPEVLEDGEEVVEGADRQERR
jgi:hypothetical protein